MEFELSYTVIDHVKGDSRYKNTEIIELEDGTVCQVTWEPTNYTETTNDKYVEVKAGRWRLDLLANYFYGNQHYWWIIALANNIIDPFMELNDLSSPRFLRIPSPDSIR